MTKEPPTQPDTEQANEPQLSMQQQIDRLITQIETEEPGTLDPALLPEGFVSPNAKAKPKPAPAPAPEPSPTQEALAEAVTDFEEALEPQPQAEAEPAAPPAPAPAAKTKPINPAEADLLAQLNAALQDMNPKKQEPAPAAEPEPAPTQAKAESLSEDDLQAQISALLNAEPKPPAAQPEVAEPVDHTQAERDAAVEADLSTQDQIANEIQSLLDADQSSDSAAEQADPSIDELDRMLSEEIEEDEELAGDFESVQAITAGIEGTQDETIEVDEHAAMARDVAAELDSQPENKLGSSDTDEDPDAVLSEIAQTAEANAIEAERQLLAARGWLGKLNRFKDRLLHACFAINWPARHFLTAEHRANLGYIALLNLFGAAAVWLYLIFF